MAENTASAALILLDLQNEMVSPEGKLGASGMAKVVAERNVLANAKKVLAAFRTAGLPVFHVRLGFRPDYADALSVAPRIARLKAAKAAIVDTWGSEFPDEVAPREGELVFTKQCVNPFFNSALLNVLMQRGVRHVVLGGVATNMVVESTARTADDAGFKVTVLEDCCASANPDWHRASIEYALPLFGEVTNSDAFIVSLAK